MSFQSYIFFKSVHFKFFLSNSKMNRSRSRHVTFEDDEVSINRLHEDSMKLSRNRAQPKSKLRAAKNAPRATPKNNSKTAPRMNHDEEMVCICVPRSAVQMNKNGMCHCICSMTDMKQKQRDHYQSQINVNEIFEEDSLDGGDFDLMGRELSSTFQDLPQDESILEVPDDPESTVILGRNYRVNSYR